jgi:hypothetical protein
MQRLGSGIILKRSRGVLKVNTLAGADDPDGKSTQEVKRIFQVIKRKNGDELLPVALGGAPSGDNSQKAGKSRNKTTSTSSNNGGS